LETKAGFLKANAKSTYGLNFQGASFHQMDIKPPEDLGPFRICQIVSRIREYDPELYAELLPPIDLTKEQRLKVLDNLLLDHPHVYCTFFTKVNR
jgi:hypothetical protein